jgi:hypothetical protein
MEEYFFEYKKCLNEMLCEDIIEKFEENICPNKNIFEIPKNNIYWKKIEKILYKELLLKLNLYKGYIIQRNDADCETMLSLLNENLYTKSLVIEKINPTNNEEHICIKYYNKHNNRFNVLSYILYLNTPLGGGGEINYKNNVVNSEFGKLVFFNYNIYKDCYFKRPKNDYQYIIYGELCSNNVI